MMLLQYIVHGDIAGANSARYFAIDEVCFCRSASDRESVELWTDW